jgi:fructokinase
MRERWGQSPERLPDTHPAWDLESDYIAWALANLIYAYSPRRIILGGGVSQHVGLLEATRCKVRQFINGYIQASAVQDRIDEYILPPALGNRSGVLGAIALAGRLVRGKQ